MNIILLRSCLCSPSMYAMVFLVLTFITYSYSASLADVDVLRWSFMMWPSQLKRRRLCTVVHHSSIVALVYSSMSHLRHNIIGPYIYIGQCIECSDFDYILLIFLQTFSLSQCLGGFYCENFCAHDVLLESPVVYISSLFITLSYYFIFLRVSFVLDLLDLDKKNFLVASLQWISQQRCALPVHYYSVCADKHI